LQIVTLSCEVPRTSGSRSRSRIMIRMRGRSTEVVVTVRVMMNARYALKGDGEKRRANIAMKMMRGVPRGSGSGREARRAMCGNCAVRLKGGLQHG
jgi:hypothetical protein